MNDLVSRTDAIKHLKKRLYETALNSNTEHPYYEEIADNRIDVWMNEVPSIASEIIHCGDCWYKDDGIDEDGIHFLKCLHGRSYGGTRINDFCSWAERRTDEGSD